MRLPAHHVPRQRLVGACADHQLVVAEAAGGYGKSVLGQELVDAWGVVGIHVRLDADGVNAPLFAARLHAALLQSGFTDAASAVDEASDPQGAVDAVTLVLRGERCAFVVDDAHGALPDAAALLDRLSTQLEDGQRLVVLARRLPPGAERLRRAEALHLSSADLAMNDAEIMALCRRGFSLSVDAASVRSLSAATGGWTAATVLAAARVARTGGTVERVLGTFAGRTPGEAVSGILDEVLTAFSSADLGRLAQVARLPLLDAAVVDEAVEAPGFFNRLLDSGVPLAVDSPPWYAMPDPVREHLTGLGPLDVEAVRRAAVVYAQRGVLVAALQSLLRVDDHDSAAELLARASQDAVDAQDASELEAHFDRLDPSAIDEHPWALIPIARYLRVATRFEQANALAARATELAVARGDPALERAARAESAHELLRQLRPADAAEVSRSVLDTASNDEVLTRARAFHALACGLCWEVDEHGRRVGRALQESAQCFERASAMYRDLGMRSSAAALVPYWAINLEFTQGQATRALARLDAALADAIGRPRRWGFVMCFRGWVAADLGLDDICQSSLSEALAIGEQLDSDVLRALAHWKSAIHASYRGDADATIERIRLVEQHTAGWWESGSGDFLAEAADLLDRVGHVAPAREYLERVRAEPKDAAHLVALSEAAIEARHGDPERGLVLIDALAEVRVDPRDGWRTTLLRGLAHYRSGDGARAGALAAQAFEEAARVGQPTAPLIRERAVTEELLGLAAETGAPAASALRAVALPRSLSLLGRFELTAAGRPVRVGPGQDAQLLKLVAVSGGRIHAERVIETMWPDVGIDTGRNRLRRVLNRLRAAAGEVIVREGESLVLDPGVRVDVAELFVERRRAAALAPSEPSLAAAIARGAIALYRGDLLPDDPFEDWVEPHRIDARDAMLDLLALCVAEAAERGDLDDVRRLVQRGIELAPYDDTLTRQIVSSLIQRGRRAEARSVLRRARAALAEFGLEPPAPLLDLERSLT